MAKKATQLQLLGRKIDALNRRLDQTRVPLSRIGAHERRAEIARFIEAGHSVRDASVRFKVCTSTIRNACDGAGVPVFVGSLRIEFRPLEVVALLQNTTKSANSIAKQLGITKQRISQIFIQAKGCGVLFPGRGCL